MRIQRSYLTVCTTALQDYYLTSKDVPFYTANATDADEGRNAAISYSLSAVSPTTLYFAIDPNTGGITPVRDLDYEDIQVHQVS